MENFSKKVVQSYFVITTGTLLSSALYITFLTSNSTLSLSMLWQILGCGLVTAPLSFIFYSSHELSKKAALFRQLLHYLTLNVVLVLYANFAGWISIHHPVQVLAIILLTLLVYSLVWLNWFFNDAKEAKELSQKLQEYQNKK